MGHLVKYSKFVESILSDTAKEAIENAVQAGWQYRAASKQAKLDGMEVAEVPDTEKRVSIEPGGEIIAAVREQNDEPSDKPDYADGEEFFRKCGCEPD